MKKMIYILQALQRVHLLTPLKVRVFQRLALPALLLSVFTGVLSGQCDLYVSNYAVPTNDQFLRFNYSTGTLQTTYTSSTLSTIVWDLDFYKDYLISGVPTPGLVVAYPVIPTPGGPNISHINYVAVGAPYAAFGGNPAGSLSGAPAFDFDATLLKIYVVDNAGTKGSVIRFDAPAPPATATNGVHFINISDGATNGGGLIGVLADDATGDVYVLFKSGNNFPGLGAKGGVARYNSSGVLLDINVLSDNFNGGAPNNIWQFGPNGAQGFEMILRNGKLYIFNSDDPFDASQIPSGVLEVSYNKTNGGSGSPYTATWGSGNNFFWFGAAVSAAGNFPYFMKDPRDMEFGPDGHLYVLKHGNTSDPSNPSEIYKFDGTTGALLSTFGSAAATFKGLTFACSCVTPTATAAATQPTCVGAGAPNNGTITINGFTAGQRYQYSSGATFNSGAAVPASITAIPVGGVITSTLPNTTQQYTVRIYDAADDACFVDRVVSITAVNCCVNPTHNPPSSVAGSCTGGTPNNDATITVTGIANADRIGISTGATYSGTPAYAAATPIVGAMHTFNGLMHNTQYTIRLFNGADNCFTDVTITTASIACCTVTINSSTPSACVPATNTYSLTVSVTWANASGTTLTVTTPAPGATPQTITTTAGSSGTQSVTFTGLTANATMYNVTAQFDAGCTATTTNAFTAPPACSGCPTGDCGSTNFLKRI